MSHKLFGSYFLVAICILFVNEFTYSQVNNYKKEELSLPKKKGQHQELETRIVSISHWQEMAKLGLVRGRDSLAHEESIITPSRAQGKGVFPPDSPDTTIIDTNNTTQSENSVFIDPTDPSVALNSNNSSDWPVTIIYGADAFVSSDMGKTWSGSVQGAGGTNRGDPATAIDRDGRFYVGYIANNRGQGVAWSSDFGQTWHHVQVTPGLTTAYEYYFNRLRPNSYQKNRTPYQRMKHGGIQSQTAENACLWSVAILDDPKLKRINFNLPLTGYHVCKFDDMADFSA